MRKWLFSIFFLLFGFKVNKSNGNKKGSLTILVDGLSYDALIYAIKTGYCPTLKRFSASAPIQKYFCGLPAATTSTEALLFYGNSHNIPGFTWYDRTLKQFVRGNRSAELAQFEDMYTKKRNLYTNGSVIMGVYTGGATELSISGRDIKLPASTYILNTVHYLFMAFLYPVQLIRALSLSLKTILFYRKSTKQKSLQTFSKIFLGQFSCFLTEIELMRGTEKIFVDFLLYDEYAHEYGPTHSNTLSTLRLVDRYINRIVKTARSNGKKYEVILLSDHGQTESIPFDYPVEKSSLDIALALSDPNSNVIKTYGSFIPNRQSNELYSVPAGSTLQLYFSKSLDKGFLENEIEEIYPGFISRLLTYEEFGWLLVRRNSTNAVLYGKSGTVSFFQEKDPLITGTPFPHLLKSELQLLLDSFNSYFVFPNNGDIVLFGNVTPQKKVYSFEKHKGTHGGFYGPMVYPFIMSKNPDIRGVSMSDLFDTIEESMI